MPISLVKRALLAGTALVAATAFTAQAQAATATLTTNTNFASAGTHTSSPADGTAASAGDAVHTNGFILGITNNGTANDGEGANTFTVGAISGTTVSDGVLIANGSAANLAVNIASVSETAVGGDGFGVLNALNGTGTATYSNSVTVTGALVTGGPLAVGNTATTGSSTVSLNVDGALTTGGAAVLVAAGALAGENAILTLKGAGLNTLAPLSLADGGASASTGSAQLVIAGTAAQTISGTIDGEATGQGTLTVSNTSGGVTFSSAIGSNDSLRAINAGVAGTTTTFNGAVNAATLNVTGTGTIALGAQAFAGNIKFGGNNGLLTLSSGSITGNIDTTTTNTGVLTISGAGTVTGNIGSATAGDTLSSVNAGAAGTTTITGTVNAASLNVTGAGGIALGGTLTGDLNYGGNNGTVTLASGQNITGVVSATNTGVLTLAGTNTVTGNVGTLGVLNAAQAGGTSTFSGTVGATAINIGTGSVSFGKTVTGAIDLAGHNGTILVATGASINGSVNSTASSSGTLTLQGGTQSVTGAIGTTNALTQVNAGQAGGTTTFGALVKAATLSIGTGSATLQDGFTGTASNFTGNGTLHLAAGQTFTGAVATSTASTGNFEFDGSGTVTQSFGSGNALNMLTLGGTGNTATVNGNIIAANITNVGGNTLATNGTFTLGATQTLGATITGAGTTGHVAATGIATIASGAKLDILISPTYFPTVGALPGTYDIVTGAGGGSVGTVSIVSSPLYTFTQVSNANDLEITGVRNSMASVASSSNNASVGNALDRIGSTGNPALDAVQTDLNSVTSRPALNTVLSSLTPTVDGGAQNSVREVGAAIQDIADTRMSALRDDDGSSGVSSGYSTNGNSIWVQGYAQSATQSAQDGIAGYTATTGGGAVGIDTQNLIDEGIVGVMFNYGQTGIDSKNVNATKTTLNNYGVNLYGTGYLVEQMFLEWQAGYSYNTISSTRHDVGAAGINASGDTNSKEFDGRLELGKDYAVGYGTLFTPDANMSFTHLNTNGYTETGSGANLIVGSNSQNALDFGIGAKMSWNLKSYYGPILKPNVHIGYSYAAIDDRIETTSNFAGAASGTNPSFTTTGPTPSRSRFDIGAGVTYWTYANWDASANTNYEYRPDYHAYSGVLRMTGHF